MSATSSDTATPSVPGIMSTDNAPHCLSLGEYSSHIRDRYDRFVIVSHPEHLRYWDPVDPAILIVSCNWLLWQKAAADGWHCIYMDSELGDADSISVLGDRLFLRAVDWIYDDDEDVTLFQGVSLGRRCIRDMGLYLLETEFLRLVVDTLTRKFKPREVIYMDWRTEWGVLDDDERFQTVGEQFFRNGISIIDRRMPITTDSLSVPHSMFVGHAMPTRPSLRARLRGLMWRLFETAVTMATRIWLGVEKTRPRALILTTHLNGAPLLEAYDGSGVVPYYLSQWFPKARDPVFVLNCLAKGVHPVTLRESQLTDEDRQNIERIEHRLDQLLATGDDNGDRLIRHFLARRVIKNGRLSRLAAQVRGVGILLDRLQPSIVFTDGLQNSLSNIFLSVAKNRGITTAATWHATWAVDIRMDMFGGDPRTEPLADYCFTWGKVNEAWLDANDGCSAKIRTGSVVSSRYRRIAPATIGGRRALVLQYVAAVSDVRALYTNANEYGYFVEVIRQLRKANYSEVRFKLHPGHQSLNYYRSIAEFFGLDCEVCIEGPFHEHLKWADIVIGTPSSGAMLEAIAAGKPFYPVLLPPFTLNTAYLQGLKVFHDLESLGRALGDNNLGDQGKTLEAFTSKNEIPDPAKQVWKTLHALTGPQRRWPATRR